MIGIVKRVFEPATLVQMRRKAECDPTPRGTIELCRQLIRHGRREDARRSAADGLGRWPRSVELRDVLQAIFKHEAQDSLNERRRRVAEEGDFDAWQELIDQFLSHENLDAAIDLIEEHQSRFGDLEVAQERAGELYFRRLRRDHVREDAEAAIECFEAAIESNERNHEARISLAELLLYVGAPGRAVLHLYEARRFAEDGSVIEGMITHAQELPLEQDDLPELLRMVEERDAPHSDSASSDIAIPHARRDGWIQRLSLLDGVRRVALQHDGEVVLGEDGFCRAPGDARDEPLVALAAGLHRSARMSTKRMGIGAFNEAELTWEKGGVLAVSAGPVILLAELGAPRPSADVANAARDLVASLTSSVIHA